MGLGRSGVLGALVALGVWGCGGQTAGGDVRAPERVTQPPPEVIAETPPEASEPPPEASGPSPGDPAPQEPTPPLPSPEPPRASRRYASACSRSDYWQSGGLRARERFGADGVQREQESFQEDGTPMVRKVQKVEGGLLLMQEQYSNSKLQMRATWTYREDGQALRLDHEENGAYRGQTTWTYGASGEVLQSAYMNRDGLRTSLISYFYDGQGRLERKDHARGNGVVESETLYTYGPHGLTSETFKDVGPLVYTAKTWQHHPNGQISREDVWMEPHRHMWREFDTEGREVRSGNMLDESSARSARTYDARGLLVRERKDAIGSFGSLQSEETFTYDTEGRLTSRLLVADSTNNWTGLDSRVRESYRYGYDARGDLATQTCDTTEDGVPDWTRTFTRDAFGNLLEERLEGTARPIELGRTVYTYECHE